MDDFARDLRQTLRRLMRTPGFTLATVATLALGIGANTAIFSVVNSVLLKPLPFPQPDRLVGVWQTAPRVNIKDLNASIADYLTYREESKTFADVAIWTGRSVNVTEFAEAERAEGFSATSRLLPLLGVQPVLGRQFTDKDSEEGSPEVLMLGYGYWQRRFGGDAGVIGRRIMADGTAREIVGILPKDFWFMDMQHDVLLPVRFNRAEVRLAGYNFRAVARLQPGATLQQADADVARTITIQQGKYPPPEGMTLKMLQDVQLGPNVHKLKDDLLGDVGKSLWVVMATIGLVLLIACANVANLLLVRQEGRAQELAVRTALGASRGRIARELLVESLTLALVGGVLGIAFASVVLKLILATLPARLPRFEFIAVDSTALLFTLAISVMAGFALGSLPVLRQIRAQVNGALRAGGRNASASRERHITRNALTVVQVALALVLLVGSGLMIRTFQSMRRVHPGFKNVETLETLRISIPRTASQADDQFINTFQALSNQLAGISGVEAVGFLNGLPMTQQSSQDPIYASDRDYAANQIPPLRRFITAGPGAFQTLGTSMVAGREYSWTDVQNKRSMAIVSENFAREYWGSAQAALGKQIRTNAARPWSEIIGVAGDILHDGADQKAPSTIYWPLWQWRGANSMTFLVRTPRTGTESLRTEIRQAVAAVQGGLPITDSRSMKEVYDRSMARTSFTLTLLAISGGMALLLSAIGIYAVISYSVAQRTREIGIRLALGAQQSSLKMMFVRNGLLWGATGAAAGLLAAAALARLMSSLLFEISPVDPLTYATVAIALLAAAAIASYLPARRITRVDPVDALRAE